MRRRDFITGLLATTALATPANAGRLLRGSPVSACSGGPLLQVNLTNPTYYNQVNQFLNWWKTGNNIYVYRSTGGNLFDGTTAYQNGYFDSNGQLTVPANSVITAIAKGIYAPPPQSYIGTLGANYVGETFKATWTGTSVCTVSSGTVTASTSNSINFTMDGSTCIANFTVPNPNDPPLNIKIFQTRYATNVTNGEVFNPDWINQVKQYKILRCMDLVNTNNSQMTDFGQLADLNYDFYGQFFGIPFTDFTGAITYCPYGTKGGLHPEILCALATATGCDLHICIPFHATPSFISSFATYMFNHCSTQVTYELSNEMWNGGFYQYYDCASAGNAIWPGDAAAPFKYAGYASALMLNLVRGAYGGTTSRWRGAQATLNANSAILSANVVGAQYYITNVLSNSVTYNQLFQTAYGTGYFGDGYLSTGSISVVTTGNPTIITIANNGLSAGAELRVWFDVASGLNSVNGFDGTVQTVFNANTFSINIDTTGLTFVNDGFSYATPALIFNMMDTSAANHVSNPALYPDIYVWFNQQLQASHTTGTCTAGYTTSVNLNDLVASKWPALLSVASANGLTLRQYEGCNSFVGDAYLEANGGNAQFTDYLIHYARSTQCATVQSAMFLAWAAFGDAPSKYEFDGQLSQFGPWPAVNFWPTVANGGVTDTLNPIVVSMNNFNAGCP